ncbi:unnamed protein product [Closterium sp. NIES-65]|nr:unnamed protein product [Closterium sp. NIES-65]
MHRGGASEPYALPSPLVCPASPPSYALLPPLICPASPPRMPCFPTPYALLPPLICPSSPPHMPCFPPSYALLPPLVCPASPPRMPCFLPSYALLPPLACPASPPRMPCFPPSYARLPPLICPASPPHMPIFPPSYAPLPPPSYALLPPIPFSATPPSPFPLPPLPFLATPPSPSLLPPIPFPTSSLAGPPSTPPPAPPFNMDLMPIIDRDPVGGTPGAGGEVRPPKKLRDVGAGVGAVGSDEEDEKEQLRLAPAASMEGHTEDQGGDTEGGEQGAWAGGAAEEEVELPEEPSVRIPASRCIAIRCPDGTRLQCRFRAQALSAGSVPILQNNLLATRPTSEHCPSCHAHSLALPLTPLFSHAPLPTPPAARKPI